MTETNPASESRNPPSKSFVFNDSTSNEGEYLVSGILAGDELILLNSNFDGIEKITSRHFKTMPLRLEKFTKFAQFLVVDRANCN
jgi:hypothetical protein